MGACGSSEGDASVAQSSTTAAAGVGSEAVKYNHSIEKQLIREQQTESSKVKLLLLGAGESGKSTIFKQMRILYGQPRSDEELRMYGVIIRSNIIVIIKKIVFLLKRLDMEAALDEESNAAKYDDGELTLRQAYDELLALCGSEGVGSSTASTAPQDANPAGEGTAEVDSPSDVKDWVGKSSQAGPAANEDARLFLKHWKAIRTFWHSQTAKAVWTKRSQANVIDGHKEYLQEVTRIASPTFKPNNQDILNARVKTTTVSKEKYLIDGVNFEIYDVGGQRSERRKWMDCFDSVDAVIFVAALSEYDQLLAESRKTNRMVEALELFRSVANNRAFKKASVMLFLNKKDIFAEKIMYSHIVDQPPFSDFSGESQNFDEGVLYFITKFKECRVDQEDTDQYTHVTCATDTNNMEFVLESARTIIMTQSLRSSGFLGA